MYKYSIQSKNNIFLYKDSLIGKKQMIANFTIILLLSLSMCFSYVHGSTSNSLLTFTPIKIAPNLTNGLPNSSIYFLPIVINKSSMLNYYIDNNNGSDSNSGTQPNQPWKTLAKLNSAQILPGSTVNLKRGSIWTEKLRLYASGQAGLPIIITAYGSGEAPILSNPGDTDNNESVISLYGSFIIIDSLIIQDSGFGITIWRESTNNIIQNNEIRNTGEGIAIDGQYNLITRNYIHDLHMVVSTPGGNGDDWGANGVDIQNAHNEVSFNQFVNCEAFSYDYGMSGGVIEIFNLGDYTSIHHNWSYQSGGFIEVSSSGSGSATNVTISYNVVINATLFSVIHISDQYATQIRDFRVENNTIVDLRAHNPLIGSYIDFAGAPLPDSYILRNNIIYISDYYWVSRTQFTHQNNLYYFLNSKTTLGYAVGPGEFKADPQFIDLANFDLHLRSTSPAINEGINLGYTEDFDQNPVPINNLPDLGAYEYQGY